MPVCAFRHFLPFLPDTCAVSAGAQVVLDESFFPEAKEGTAMVGPTVLTNVDHCKSFDNVPIHIANKCH